MSEPTDENYDVKMLVGECDALREQVATLTAERVVLDATLVNVKADRQFYKSLTEQRDGRRSAAWGVLRAERDNLRADVERLTKELDSADKEIGRLQDVGFKLQTHRDNVVADNARHLAAIETLRAEKSTMEDALFNLVNDIPDAIGEAYNRGISDGHPICNMPTGVKDITKALLEHADYAKKADEVEDGTFAQELEAEVTKALREAVKPGRCPMTLKPAATESKDWTCTVCTQWAPYDASDGHRNRDGHWCKGAMRARFTRDDLVRAVAMGQKVHEDCEPADIVREMLGEVEK